MHYLGLVLKQGGVPKAVEIKFRDLSSAKSFKEILVDRLATENYAIVLSDSRHTILREEYEIVVENKDVDSLSREFEVVLSSKTRPFKAIIRPRTQEELDTLFECLKTTDGYRLVTTKQ